jgi:hypothetical protein
MIIPRAPSPALPADDGLEGLTEGDIRRLARERLADVKVGCVRTSPTAVTNEVPARWTASQVRGIARQARIWRGIRSDRRHRREPAPEAEGVGSRRLDGGVGDECRITCDRAAVTRKGNVGMGVSMLFRIAGPGSGLLWNI